MSLNPAAPPASPVHDYDMYRMISEHTRLLSERRQTSGHVLLAINIIILISMAVLLSQSESPFLRISLLCFPLTIMGFLTSFFWLSIINRNNNLVSWRYEQIKRLELQLTIPIHFFTSESTERYGEHHISLIHERLLSVVLMIIYVAFAVGLVVAAVAG